MSQCSFTMALRSQPISLSLHPRFKATHSLSFRRWFVNETVVFRAAILYLAPQQGCRCHAEDSKSIKRKLHLKPSHDSHSSESMPASPSHTSFDGYTQFYDQRVSSVLLGMANTYSNEHSSQHNPLYPTLFSALVRTTPLDQTIEAVAQ
jgi:hypothetical protein